MTEQPISKDVALGRAANWTLALLICGIFLGLSTAYDGGVWLVVWLVLLLTSPWVAHCQFKSMERLVESGDT